MFHNKILQTNLKVQPLGCRLEGPGFESQQGQQSVFRSKTSRTALGSTHSAVHSLAYSMSTGFFPAGKAVHSLSYSTSTGFFPAGKAAGALS